MPSNCVVLDRPTVTYLPSPLRSRLVNLGSVAALTVAGPRPCPNTPMGPPKTAAKSSRLVNARANPYRRHPCRQRPVSHPTDDVPYGRLARRPIVRMISWAASRTSRLLLNDIRSLPILTIINLLFSTGKLGQTTLVLNLTGLDVLGRLSGWFTPTDARGSRG
jgi:hypothetical protein